MKFLDNYITEQFLTIQGEGRSVGKLAYFIRFAGCNLWCQWCDSLHSVDPKLYKERRFFIDYEKIPKNCQLIVLTGGEPTLFDLESVRERLLIDHPQRLFEVESNATQFPAEIVDHYFWNLSPKLRSSLQKNQAYDDKRLIALEKWAHYSQNNPKVIFKFVVSSSADLNEVDELVRTYHLNPTQVYLMAEGSKKEQQQLAQVEWVIEACKIRGMNFSPRLHTMFWGDQRGV